MAQSLQEPSLYLDKCPAPHLIKRFKKPAAQISHRKLALTNLVYFFIHVLGNNIAACLDYKTCADSKHFHGEWCRIYESGKSTYICSSRRHIKSTWSQGLAVWEGIRKRQTIVVGMNSYSQVIIWMDIFSEMLQFVIDSLNLDIAVTNNVKIVGSSVKGGIKLSNGTVIYPRSLGGKYRGLNPDILIIDDLLDKEMKMTFEKAESRFRADILGARVEKTKTIYVGTIIQDGDVTYKIIHGEIGGGSFEGGVYPAVPEAHQQEFRDFVQELVDKDLLKPYLKGQDVSDRIVIPDIPVLWPEVRTLRYLVEQWDLVGDVEFEVEYFLNIIPEKSALIPTWMIERAKDRGLNLKLGRPRVAPQSAAGVDLQISVSGKADWSVVFSLEVFDDYVSILDIDRFQGHELETDGEKGEVEDYTRMRILQAYEMYDHWLIYVEDVGFQKTIANQLRKDYAGIPVENFKTGTNKHQGTVGIPSLRDWFLKNRVVIPWGNERTRKLVGQFLHELRGMQWSADKKQYVSKTRNDDMVMAFWIALAAALEVMSRGRARFSDAWEGDDDDGYMLPVP